MNMNMKSLNVFRRLDEIETDNLYLRTLLKNARADIEALKKTTKEQTQWLASLQSTVTPKPKAKPGPKAVKSKETLDKAAEKKRAYAKAYYAKKRAEKAAA